jgi:diamine N-acetyltransferase
MKGKTISFRAPELEDLDILYKWENDTSIWYLSNTLTPFSKYVLQEYILSANLDIFSTKQLRLMIVKNDDQLVIGSIDLFDFDPANLRAGIGILIDSDYRHLGYATEAIDMMVKYCFDTLGLHQVYSNIATENLKSIALFEKAGFVLSGTKKEWIKQKGKWLDEHFYQLIKKEI